ncbi:MAG: hypothetical protein HN793_15410, partial [Rhodospirillaceae bacterium]|nr:hypothetical protein [Rhodospirillaceae bacterium]
KVWVTGGVREGDTNKDATTETYSGTLTKALYVADGNGSSAGFNGGGGTPSAGSVTLDMLSPEVKARLENTVLAKSTATAPAGYVLQRLDMDYNPQVLNTSQGQSKSGFGKVGQKIYALDHEGVGIDVFDLETNSSSNKQATSSNPTRSHGVASLNGLVYAIGGTISNVPTNRVRSYDPAANSYTELGTMNRAREHPFPITFNNKIYVFGGINQSGRVDSVERYDPVANTWTEVSQLPVPVRSNHEQICPVVVGEKLYVLIPHPSSKIGYLYHYNGEDTWVRKADFPHPEEGNRDVTFSHGNKIFVIGKSTYDEATNQWLPTRYGSWNHGGSSFGSRVVCFVEGNKMISIGGMSAGIMSMDLSKIRYFFVSDGDSIGSFSVGGTPAAGSITLDMLSPEVKARLTDANATASAPVGATLFMPYGVKGTPVSGGNTYTVPDGKVLITGHYRGYIKVNGNEVNFYSAGDGTNDAVNDVVILPSGTSFSTTYNNSPGGGFIGMLFDNRPDITAVVGGGGYSVPAGKTFFLTSASGRVNGLSRHPAIGKIPLILGSGSGFGLTDGPQQTSPGFTGYLKDN